MTDPQRYQAIYLAVLPAGPRAMPQAAPPLLDGHRRHRRVVGAEAQRRDDHFDVGLARDVEDGIDPTAVGGRQGRCDAQERAQGVKRPEPQVPPCTRRRSFPSGGRVTHFGRMASAVP